jgi:hypothetical protein
MRVMTRPAGRDLCGPQPAKAIGNASDDATARAANAALRVVGKELTDPRVKQRAGAFVHLAFGAITGRR